MGKLKDFQKYIERKILPGNNPDFLIIGAQKSGTTTLFYYLNKHPRLAGSCPKEMQFFSKQMHNGKDLDWYRNHFTSLKKNALFFEASPMYMSSEGIAQEIKKIYPNIKLILILRNPVERAFSAWNMYYEHFRNGRLRERLPPYSATQENLMYQNLTEGRSDYPTFKEVVQLELTLIEKGEPLGVNFLRRGLYYEQICGYLKYFNRDQLHILGIKDLTMDPQKTIQEILDFLHVDQPCGWQPPVLKAKNKRTYSVKLEPAEREVLSEFYKESNQNLRELLGRELNW